ncbi:unnamed protein product [Effrenium voratum]|nr:unnamed protein product [Effrenium voratum]
MDASCPKSLDGTTLMLQRVPASMSLHMLQDVFHRIAQSKFDFIYLPHHCRTQTNIHLAFVNFTDKDTARKVYDLLRSRGVRSLSNVRVSPADVQGLPCNLAYFVARFGLEALQEPNGPLILQDGQRVNPQEAFARLVPPEVLESAVRHLHAERVASDGNTRRVKRVVWNCKEASPKGVLDNLQQQLPVTGEFQEEDTCNRGFRLKLMDGEEVEMNGFSVYQHLSGMLIFRL